MSNINKVQGIDCVSSGFLEFAFETEVPDAICMNCALYSECKKENKYDRTN